jgi:putative transposase
MTLGPQDSNLRDDEDREMLLTILAWVVERFKWHCHAYCLMDHHVYLLD